MESPLESLLKEQAAKAAVRRRRVLVMLPQEKVEDAISLARGRNLKEQRYGPMTYGSRLTGIEAHVIGVVAEQGVAHHFGVEVDAAIHARGDNGIDLVLPGLGRTGVKCTTYGADPLLRVEGEHLCEGVAAYLLAHVDPRRLEEVWLIGWATKAEVVKGRKARFVANGPVNYVLHEGELRGLDVVGATASV
jgi:hypothetical protein